MRRSARRWPAAHRGERALLDQSLISGVGNIYADEACGGAAARAPRPTS